MSKAIVKSSNIQSIERVLIHGDLSPMTEAQRLQYVKAVCKSIGVSILFRPFDYIKLNGKVVLYANRSCTEQLRKLHKISIKITSRERVDGLYCVTAQATGAKGKTDESIGAVNIKGLSGEALANALMKAETKAKRRVTLSIAGLGMLDEVEAKELADKEAKITGEIAAEETEAKIADTTERPEFETEKAPVPSIEKEPPTSQCYVLKAGKIKGKRLDQVPLKKLAEWIKWYEAQTAAGKPLHPDIQDDAFAIYPFMQEAGTAKAAQPELPPNG